MQPYIVKSENKTFLKLHKDIYKKQVLNKLRKEDPETITDIRLEADYYLLELQLDDPEDYFSFLNYLIYSNQTR